jgi:hypothetical protein
MNKSCYLVLSLLIAACGGAANNRDANLQPDGAHEPTLDAAKCTAFAQSFATAASTCGTALPAGAQTSFEGWCEKGVSAAALCGGDPAGGLDCFASADPGDWVCELGQPHPSCGGDLGAALGALCVVALGNPSCATGLHCDYNADCSSGLACNSVTHECFSETAYCIGLPCAYDVDCPSQEKCNSAEHACVGN